MLTFKARGAFLVRGEEHVEGRALHDLRIELPRRADRYPKRVPALLLEAGHQGIHDILEVGGDGDERLVGHDARGVENKDANGEAPGQQGHELPQRRHYTARVTWLAFTS